MSALEKFKALVNDKRSQLTERDWTQNALYVTTQQAEKMVAEYEAIMNAGSRLYDVADSLTTYETPRLREALDNWKRTVEGK